MVAKFKGKDSMGFKAGKIYKLSEEIKPVPGVYKPCICLYDIGSNAWCPYESVKSLLKNWEIIEI